MFLKTVRGSIGEVSIPSMGATVGKLAKWSLERREDRTSGVGVYVFRGAFSYLNPYLFKEESLRKEIRVRLGNNGKWHRIEQVPDTLVHMDGNVAIVMDEVTVWPIEDSAL